MNLVAKTILMLTLSCYVVVSSIAAAHAFPSSGQLIRSDQAAITKGCHQKQSSQAATGVSTCKIFCASIGSIIMAEMIYQLPPIASDITPTFFLAKPPVISLAVEPHPPK